MYLKNTNKWKYYRQNAHNNKFTSLRSIVISHHFQTYKCPFPLSKFFILPHDFGSRHITSTMMKTRGFVDGLAQARMNSMKKIWSQTWIKFDKSKKIARNVWIQHLELNFHREMLMCSNVFILPKVTGKRQTDTMTLTRVTINSKSYFQKLSDYGGLSIYSKVNKMQSFTTWIRWGLVGDGEIKTMQQLQLRGALKEGEEW